MIIPVCLIVKDDTELEKLKVCIDSFIEYVDEVIVVANHIPSDKIEAYCAADPKLHYYYHEWNNDFSDQRNFAASKIHPKALYYLWADSDDVIIGAEKLREAFEICKKNNWDTLFFDYWYGNKFDGKPSVETFKEVELTQKRERIIRKDRIYWKKRIHETPIPVDGKNSKYSQLPYSKEWPVVWLHLGADRDISPEDMQKKTERNRKILELELADERKKGEADPRTILYYMKVLVESDKPEDLQLCLELGKEYLSKSGWDQERAVCFQLMSRAVAQNGSDNQARDFLHNALKEYPYNPLLYLYLARVYYNMKNYRAMKHWLQVGLSIPIEKNSSAMNNILEMKVLSAELMLELYLYGERDVRKAYQSAKTLNKVNPTKDNEHNQKYLEGLVELDKASEHTHKYMEYLKNTGQFDLIPRVYSAMPPEMQNLPFANRYYNHYKEPKRWKENEICYYANFDAEHFEKWDGNSIEKGIGGSETAVIRLAEEWTKKGYEVTVYGDPRTEITVNGVHYVPFYKFNSRDKFNIFIQWRHSYMAKRITAKKFLVDLHDVFFATTHEDRLDAIDRFMVKSNYHRNLASEIEQDKFEVISNGI